MAGSEYIDKQKILKFIKPIPFTPEEKERWQQWLEENEVDEAFLNDLHDKLMEIPVEKFGNDWMRAKYSIDLKKFMQQWRMHNASKQFKHGH